jgi:hypothetical protein
MRWCLVDVVCAAAAAAAALRLTPKSTGFSPSSMFCFHKKIRVNKNKLEVKILLFFYGDGTKYRK